MQSPGQPITARVSYLSPHHTPTQWPVPSHPVRDIRRAGSRLKACAFQWRFGRLLFVGGFGERGARNSIPIWPHP